MEGCPKLLDLIPKEKRDWNVKMEKETNHGGGSSEEKKLELRLGPPGGDDLSRLSFACFSNPNNTSGTKRGFADSENGVQQAQKFPFSDDHHGFSAKNPPWPSSPAYQGKHFLKLQSTSSSQCQLPVVMPMESSQHCCPTKAVDLQTAAEKNAFPSPSAANTAVPNSSTAQKRTAPTSVVGWPPVRSFRKNLANNSNLKSNCGSQNVIISNKISGEKATIRSCKTEGLFVKINMDGIPIGRKVDLKAYDSYEKLSSAVDELFRGLLAGHFCCAGGIQNKGEGEKLIIGLLDGSGEYTLVYEDNEGDRMLVGDVPWHMFVSTVKRLRVRKSSEISTLCRGSKQGKLSDDASLQ